MKRDRTQMTFGQWREKQELKKSVNECSWPALILGAVLFFAMFIRSSYTSGTESLIYKCLAALGVVLFLIGGFCPLLLKKPIRLLTKLLNGVGKLLLRALLVPLYALFALLSLPVTAGGKKKYAFYRWNGSSDPLPDSAFGVFSGQVARQRSGALLSAINNVFFVLAKHKLLFLLPVVLLLLILGLVFFFLSAHSVFSFVYALF